MANILDLTGAGDAFMAGFLFGFIKNYSLFQCAKIGNLIASKIIQEIGTDILLNLTEIKKEIANF